MVETEAKVRVSDPAVLRKKILELRAHLHRERHLEENGLYDFPGRILFKDGRALRVRTIGKKTYLTFKGRPQKSRTFKIREEFETEVKSARELKKILDSLGLKLTFAYQKHRTVFRKGPLKICLDELDIGSYLELEGPRHDIVRFAKSIGIPRKELIKKDYIQLIQEARGKET
jgi:adenylate cyclase, class 2